MTQRLTTLRSAGPAVLLVGLIGAGVLTTGTAYAYWSTVGHGTASADAGTALPVDVTVSVTGGPLYPGAVLSATPTFTNPNPFPVTVTSVTPGTVAVTQAPLTCTPSSSGVVFSPLTGPWTVPATSTGTPGSAVAGAVTMSGSSDTSCQGATFTASLTVAGRSS